MKDIDYSTYYWQDDTVRLRAMKSEDWELHYLSRFDSSARRGLQYEIELPPTEDGDRQMAIEYANFNKTRGRIMFTIETLDGNIIGGINLNSINVKTALCLD